MSEIQIKILRMLIDGKSNSAIAKALGIPVWRVTRHCTGLYWELKSEGRLDTRYKYKEGLLPPHVMAVLDVKPEAIEMLLPEGLQ